MKKINNNGTPKPKSRGCSAVKVKVKSKQKNKQQQFNPLQYLNSLIEEIHDNKFDTCKKRSLSGKRELSSALAYATPITERTISSSKVRSKSSYSQYRKKSMKFKDLLTLNLQNLITEEDNMITFTEATHQSINESPQKEDAYLLSSARIPTLKSRDIAARKIQRAWRNFQTLKMVRKYYDYYNNLKRRDQGIKLRARQIFVEGSGAKMKQSIKQKELDRTLRIRKGEVKRQGKGKGDYLERVLNNNKTIKLPHIQISRGITFSEESLKEGNRQSQSNQPHLVQGNEFQTIPYRIYDRIQQSDNLQSQQYNSHDLKFILELFRSNHEQVSKQLNQKVEFICRDQKSNCQQYEDSSQEEPNNYLMRNFKNFDSQERSWFSGGLNAGLVEPVFGEMERVARQKFGLMEERLEEYVRDGLIDDQELRSKREQLRGRYLRQKRSIETCRREYTKHLDILKENVMKLQRDNLLVQKLNGRVGRQTSKLRKCFSAQSFILKAVIEDIALKNYEIGGTRLRFRVQMSLMDEGRDRGGLSPSEPIHQVVNVICPTSPPSVHVPAPMLTSESNKSLRCFENEDSDMKLREQICNGSAISDYLISQQKRPSLPQQQGADINEFNNSLVQIQQGIGQSFYSQELLSRQTDNTSNLRKCSQQIQQQIQKYLIQEWLQEIYLNDRLYNYFKVYVQQVYEFKKIADQDIIHFLEYQLPQFFQSPQVILNKINQKINPSSLEILRLIRDFDFQIQQYQLVFPEEVFKKYRRHLESFYNQRIRVLRQEALALREQQFLDRSMFQKLHERGGEKRMKKAKYVSFERDLKIMYMKAVFNCFNELLIETKSSHTYMNGRSSIGPGQLSLAIKEYNCFCDAQFAESLMREARKRVSGYLNGKCMLPQFKNYRELDLFQKQMNKQLCADLAEAEFKWVNYMDEVLEIWQQISLSLIEGLLAQATLEISAIIITQ